MRSRFSLGSSPRVRGTPRPGRRRLLRPVIIPACAGNTSCFRQLRAAIRDHPRVCGEHATSNGREWLRSGSSPRVRGTPSRSSPAAPSSRIIPACAGNTVRDRPWLLWVQDHPRVCGEHQLSQWRSQVCPGSSPRVRGTHHRVRLARPRLGIIPACAGNTASGSPCSTCDRDHPRVCGEHFSALNFRE